MQPLWKAWSHQGEMLQACWICSRLQACWICSRLQVTRKDCQGQSGYG